MQDEFAKQTEGIVSLIVPNKASVQSERYSINPMT